MIHAILLSISVVILVFCWFIYSRNIELFLCLLIALNFECFYLVPQIGGSDNYKLLLLPIILALLLAKLLKGELALGRYGLWVLAFMALSVLGVVVACMEGQDVLLGIKASKFAPFLLAYFLLVRQAVDGNKFARYFVVMGVIVALLGALQYAFHGSINIFQGMPKEFTFERLGHVRITVGQYLIAAAGVVAFARFVQSANIFYAAGAGLLFMEMAFVQQTRALIAAMLLGMLIVHALGRRLTPLRVMLYFTAAALILTTWQILPQLGMENVAIIRQTRDDIKGKDFSGSYLARAKAYRYYLGEIGKRPVLGQGMLNFNWKGNFEKRLQEARGIHLSDIGITHFFVQSGLLGLLWFGYGLVRFWTDIFRSRGNLHITCYFIVATFAMLTIDMFLRDDTLFLFAVFLGMLSSVAAVGKPDKAVTGA